MSMASRCSTRRRSVSSRRGTPNKVYLAGSRSLLPVSVLAMADFDDGYDQLVVCYLVENPVRAMANAVPFLTGEFRAASGSWVVRQILDS